MSLTEYLVTIVSLLLCVTCWLLFLRDYHRTWEIISPWILFLGMAFFDIYLPGTLYYATGLDLPPWIDSALIDRSILSALLVFTFGLALFGLGYFAVSGYADAECKGDASRPMRLSLPRAYSMLAGAGLLYAWRNWTNISSAGESVETYVSGYLVNRFRSEPITGASGVATLLLQIAGAMLPVLFVVIGIFFSRRRDRPLLWGIFFPLLGLLLAATTLLRGTIITFMIGLAIVEIERIRDAKRLLPAAGSKSNRFRQGKIWIVIAGVFLFVLFGSVRNYLTAVAAPTSNQQTPGDAFRSEMRRFIRGDGLIGLASIFDYYPQYHDFFNGKTIRDTLLLPVPRSVWTAKPEWYGIDDITRGMGWPSSTQSAVTMPGELYANFGYGGLLLMLVYGGIFGLFYRYRHGVRFRYIYAFVLVPMVLPTFWMAFSGFVNQLVPVPLIVMVIWFIFSRPTRYHQQHVIPNVAKLSVPRADS